MYNLEVEVCFFNPSLKPGCYKRQKERVTKFFYSNRSKLKNKNKKTGKLSAIHTINERLISII